MNELIRQIQQYQQLTGLSDRQLSHRLGLDKSTLSKIKNGVIGPGGKFLRQLAANIPELRMAIFDYLINEGEFSH